MPLYGCSATRHRAHTAAATTPATTVQYTSGLLTPSFNIHCIAFLRVCLFPQRKKKKRNREKREKREDRFQVYNSCIQKGFFFLFFFLPVFLVFFFLKC